MPKHTDSNQTFTIVDTRLSKSEIAKLSRRVAIRHIADLAINPFNILIDLNSTSTNA